VTMLTMLIPLLLNVSVELAVRPIRFVFGLSAANNPEYQKYATQFLEQIWRSVFMSADVATILFDDPPFMWKVIFKSAIEDTFGPSTRQWYDFVVVLGFSTMRVMFAAIFVSSWLVMPPLKWLSSLLLLRLIETEKGVLTALGATLAFVAKLVQQIMKLLFPS